MFLKCQFNFVFKLIEIGEGLVQIGVLTLDVYNAR